MNGVLSGEESNDDKVTKIISGFNAEINGLKVKNQELIGAEKKLKDSINSYETGKSDYEKQIAELTEQLKSKNDDKSKEEFYNNQLALKQKAFDEQLKKITDERDEFRKYKIENLKTQAINKGIEGLKFVDDSLKEGFIALVMANHHFEPKEIDGQTVFLDSEQKQISDVLKEFALSEKGKSFIANGITGGGSGTGTSSVSTGSIVNPFKKETRSVQKQMELYRNPATRNLARQLAEEAGIKLD